MTDVAKKNWVGSVLATAATAISGSIATDPDSAWYVSLDKPKWQPPQVVFPIVWTALYAGIAATSARALIELDEAGQEEEAAKYRAALGVNLLLNQGWSWTYFRAHRLGAATAVAGLLAASSIDLARRAKRAGKGAELVPYAAWCSFATLLTAETWRRNKSR